jgi:hypothetical protein
MQPHMIKQLQLFLFQNYFNTTRVVAFEVALDTGELNRQKINTSHPAPKILVPAMDAPRQAKDALYKGVDLICKTAVGCDEKLFWDSSRLMTLKNCI